MKKYLSLLLCICMILTVLPLGVSAATTSKEEFVAAKEAINAAFHGYMPTNDITKEELVQIAADALPAGSRVRIPANMANLYLDKATENESGFMNFTMVLMCDGNASQHAVNQEYSLSQDTDESRMLFDRSMISEVLEYYPVTNLTTEEELIAAAKAEITKGSTLHIDQKTFVKNATFETDGYIDVYFSVKNGSESGLIYKRIEIPCFKDSQKMPTDLPLNKEEWDIVRYTNRERYTNGLKPLTITEFLQSACDMRETDMCICWEHTRPDGKPFYTAVAEKYQTRGTMTENISKLTPTGIDAVASWMQSTAGHRENILDSSHDIFGVGLSTLQYGVQIFMTQNNPIVSVESSSGSFHFNYEGELYTEYLICTHKDGIVSYVPLDMDCMTKVPGGYKMELAAGYEVMCCIDIPEETIEFDDVADDAWYVDSVQWAVDNKITTGTSASTFSPDQICSRAQVITFLWRAAGEPLYSDMNHFIDITKDDYFYNAANWAARSDLLTGNLFYGTDLCTRSDAVYYLWMLAGKPAAYGSQFTDVPLSGDRSTAIFWAVQAGITNGTSATTFSPNDTCTRAQIVTFLMRAFNK